jgi:hypothetical protein
MPAGNSLQELMLQPLEIKLTIEGFWHGATHGLSEFFGSASISKLKYENPI